MAHPTVNLPTADTGVASPHNQVGPSQALTSKDLYRGTLLCLYNPLTSQILQRDDCEIDVRQYGTEQCSAVNLVPSGRSGPQYAFQPAMHAATYASALNGVSQSCAPRQLSAAAPEFVPHSARALQDLHPLISSR